MSKKAFLFPGQGSQFVGMAKDHYESNASFKQLLDKANVLLNVNLADVMFNGPEDTLKQTEFTQPAIFCHSVALFQTLDIKPDMVAGHSLGEFSALVACKAASFEELVVVVRNRGKLMQQAGIDNPGTMAAIIGMDDEVVVDACAEASTDSEAVVAANFNSPGQVVISGNEHAIDRAIEILKSKGCRIAKKLTVSGAFHSPLMQPALDGLQESLDNLNFLKPICPLYSNYTGKSTDDPDELKSNLINQLLNPVRWTQTLTNMQNDGATSFTEVGPGNVLQGLVKRTLKNVEINGYA